VLQIPKSRSRRRQESTVSVSPVTFASEIVRGLVDDAIVPALLSEFLRSRVHNKEEL
jgi:hypothetical protein